MKETLSLTKNKLHLSMAIAAFFLAFMFVSSSVVFADSGPVISIGTTSTSPSSITPNLPKAPVSMKFSPKQITVAQGSSGTATSTSKNTGTSDFDVTGCTFKITFADGTHGKGVCSPFSATVPAGGSLKLKWTFTIGATAPLGNSIWKITLTGTVNGNPMQSATGKETVIITA